MRAEALDRRFARGQHGAVINSGPDPVAPSGTALLSASSEPGFLAGLRAVLERELAAWFDSSLAYVAIIAGLLSVNALFMNEFFLTGKLDMTPFFDALPVYFVLLLPAISMRLWSEDLRTRTFELWMTLPLAPAQIVLGKFGAALVLFGVFLLGTLPIVALLAWLGSPDLLQILSGYLGAFLLGALFLAFGQFFSGLTADQLVAFLCAALCGFVLVFSGNERVVAVLDGLAPRFLPGRFLADHVSVLPHYESFVRGLVGLSSLVYFIGTAGVFLFLNTLVVRESRT